MAAYVDLDYVKLVGSMPPADVDAVDALFPGSFAAIALSVSRMFDARLHKRYVTPFENDVPEALRWHVAAVVVAELWRKRGYNPGNALDETIERRRQEALEWLKEAADSKDGLAELPTRDTGADEAAVTKGGPYGYSEQSPYVAFDQQADDARTEDANRRGT